ncbi:hypothetical protein BGW80DRAFT_1375758 [Lactifluus volemus]|nr:hypothetical protein BGW80DRAFT_1375758 [Lactifluus volemus]
MTYITICNCLSDRLCVALIRTHTFLPSSSPSQSVPLISPLLPVRPVYSPQISVSLFLSTFFRPASFRFFWAASSIELLGCNMQTPRCTPITPQLCFPSPPLLSCSSSVPLLTTTTTTSLTATVVVTCLQPLALPCRCCHKRSSPEQPRLTTN